MKILAGVYCVVVFGLFAFSFAAPGPDAAELRAALVFGATSIGFATYTCRQVMATVRSIGG